MKRAFSSIILFSIFILLAGCSTLGRGSKPALIWPSEINIMEGLCDLTIAWKDVKFSGEMSFRLRYPSTLYVEVYGPFGDTLLSMEKNGERFLMKTSQERINNEGRFRELFHISTDEFIQDITMRDIKRDDNTKTFSLKKTNYEVHYDLSPGKDNICWVAPEGSICMHLLEATFNEG